MTIEDLKARVAGLPLKLEWLCIGERDRFGEFKHTINFENGRWEVYYVERGEKFELRTFESEHEAAAYYLDWILSLPDLRTHFARVRNALDREAEA